MRREVLNLMKEADVELTEMLQHVLDHVSQFDIANPRALSLIRCWDLSLRATAEIHNQTAHRSE